MLLEKEIINKEDYTRNVEIINVKKAEVIRNSFSSLWDCNYVHHWPKPDSISDDEFKAEKRLFEKSMPVKPGPFKKVRKHFEEELENMPVLGPVILNVEVYRKKCQTPKREQKRKPKKADTSFDTGFGTTLPISSEPKVGRNDPCPCGSGKKYKKCCMNKN